MGSCFNKHDQPNSPEIYSLKDLKRKSHSITDKNENSLQLSQITTE